MQGDVVVSFNATCQYSWKTAIYYVVVHVAFMLLALMYRFVIFKITD